MTTQTISTILAGCLATLAFATAAAAQTALPGGLQITLQPGYAYVPKQGFDSVVGVLEKKDGLQIMFEMGNIPAPGAPRFGGSYVNQAQQMREIQREWLKEFEAGGRKISVAYSKQQQLTVSTSTDKEGGNFSAIAKTPAEVADVLIMAVTLGQAKEKAKP
jgi:hypothetical protein